jgi:hypothetical protein
MWNFFPCVIFTVFWKSIRLWFHCCCFCVVFVLLLLHLSVCFVSLLHITHPIVPITNSCLFYNLQKITLAKVAYILKIYYHTSFQGFILSGSTVTPVISLCIHHVLITDYRNFRSIRLKWPPVTWYSCHKSTSSIRKESMVKSCIMFQGVSFLDSLCLTYVTFLFLHVSDPCW